MNSSDTKIRESFSTRQEGDRGGQTLENEASPGHGHLSKGYPALLAPRQAGNRAHSQFSRDAIPAQLVTILLLRPSWNRPQLIMAQLPPFTLSTAPPPNVPVLIPDLDRLLSTSPKYA